MQGIQRKVDLLFKTPPYKKAKYYSNSTQRRNFIIAELSANHGGKIEIGKESIKVAKEIGAKNYLNML